MPLEYFGYIIDVYVCRAYSDVPPIRQMWLSDKLPHLTNWRAPRRSHQKTPVPLHERTRVNRRRRRLLAGPDRAMPRGILAVRFLFRRHNWIIICFSSPTACQVVVQIIEICFQPLKSVWWLGTLRSPG